MELGACSVPLDIVVPVSVKVLLPVLPVLPVLQSGEWLQAREPSRPRDVCFLPFHSLIMMMVATIGGE